MHNNSHKSEISSVYSLNKKQNKNKTNLLDYESINNNSNYSEASNNFNDSKNIHTIDNLLKSDNLLKKIDNSNNSKNLFSPIQKKQTPERQSTLVVSEMINQVSRFKSYVNEDDKKDDFIVKIDTLNRKLTSEGLKITNNLANNLPNYVSIKITHAEKKSMQYRVFWDKDKMENIRKKFRMAKEKIEWKTEIFLNKIQEAIRKGDKEKIL